MTALHTPLAVRQGRRRALLALALVFSAPVALAQVTLNADRAGGDIARFADPDLNNAHCAARCEANAQCAAWVLVKDGSQGGVNVCYLKNSVAAATPNRCCDSGVKVGHANSPTNAPRLTPRPPRGGSGAPAPAGLPGAPVPQGGEASSDWRPPPVIP